MSNTETKYTIGEGHTQASVPPARIRCVNSRGHSRQVELTRTSATSDTKGATGAVDGHSHEHERNELQSVQRLSGQGVLHWQLQPQKEPAKTLFTDLPSSASANYTFMGLDAYNLLKKATEAFLIVHCGVVIRNEKGTSYP